MSDDAIRMLVGLAIQVLPFLIMVYVLIKLEGKECSLKKPGSITKRRPHKLDADAAHIWALLKDKRQDPN